MPHTGPLTFGFWQLFVQHSHYFQLLNYKCCAKKAGGWLLCTRTTTTIARISYGNSVSLGVCHVPEPMQDQVR